MHRASLSPLSALAAHAEPLVSGGRVLLVGNAETCLAEHLLERGARLVQVLDPEHRRVAQAAALNSERRVSIAPLTESALRDSSYDCAIVEDLSLADNPRELVQGIRRAIGAQGVALVACSSDEGASGLFGSKRGSLRFAQFSEAVHATFEQVLLVAQTPFVGYAVVHLDLDAPPEPALDNGYLTGEAEKADYYVAIAGRAEVLDALELEDMTIVQLPVEAAFERGQTSQRAVEQRTARRIEGLEAELEGLRRRGSPEEIERLTADLEKRDAWIHQLEARAESADARADDAEAELERLEAELRELEGRAPAVEEDTELRERLAEAERTAELREKERRWADERVARLEGELETVLRDLDELREQEKARQDERSARSEDARRIEELSRELAEKKEERARLDQRIARQEKELRELGESLRDAEDRLVDSEKKSAERVRELERVRKEAREQAGKEAEERAARVAQERSRDLERDLHRLEAQLVERGEKVNELERQLSQLEGYARTLLVELELHKGAGAPTEALEGELETLSRSLAERDADLQAAAWKIDSLTRRLTALEKHD